MTPTPRAETTRASKPNGMPGEPQAEVSTSLSRSTTLCKMNRTTTLDTEQLHALVPLSATLGMRLDEARPDAVRLLMDWRADLCTAAGVLHGGALMALADTAGATCAYLNRRADDERTTTIESKTNLLAAVRGGTVSAIATPLKVGGSVVVVETEVSDDHHRLVAKTIQTQAMLRA
jgi:1,4-dihydroxy-2-naphthoyl-CoA hydrolase